MSQDSSSLTDLKTVESFKSSLSSSNLSVFHFWADWAEQCGQMDGVMGVLASDPDCANVKFYRVEAEELNEVSLEREISAVPTVLIGAEGKILERIDGVQPAQLTKSLKQLIKERQTTTNNTPVVKKEETEKELNDRISRIINQSTVVLFMKGNRLEPKCGFSRQAIALLEELKADYSTFDILEDNAVRQGLKKYSNWPTYPQLYHDGELLGGIDIMKEMNESGDLESTLPKKRDLNERLKSLIESAPLIIFMKGDRETPKCGFSRQMMDIMKEIEMNDFKTFDILTDDEVRQGLKKYSNWPTYPQVYVKGELIGGLDIVKELKETDELISTLKGQ